MTKANKFSPEVRERAVRMVLEHRGQYPSLWSAIESIAPKIGCVGTAGVVNTSSLQTCRSPLNRERASESRPLRNHGNR